MSIKKVKYSNIGLPGLRIHAGEFTKKFEKKLSDVHNLFEEHGIVPEMYLTEWLIPLGCYHLPLKETVSFR